MWMLAGLVSAGDHRVVSCLQRRCALLVEIIVCVVLEDHRPLLGRNLASFLVVGDADGQVGTDLGLRLPVLLGRVNWALVQSHRYPHDARVVGLVVESELVEVLLDVLDLIFACVHLRLLVGQTLLAALSFPRGLLKSLVMLLFGGRGLMLPTFLLLKQLESRGLDVLDGLLKWLTRAVGSIFSLQVAQNVEVHIHVHVDVLRIGSTVLVDGSVHLDVRRAASLADH